MIGTRTAHDSPVLPTDVARLQDGQRADAQVGHRPPKRLAKSREILLNSALTTEGKRPPHSIGDLAVSGFASPVPRAINCDPRDFKLPDVCANPHCDEVTGPATSACRA